MELPKLAIMVRREQLLQEKNTLWQTMEVSKLRRSSDVVGRPVFYINSPNQFPF